MPSFRKDYLGLKSGFCQVIPKEVLYRIERQINTKSLQIERCACIADTLNGGSIEYVVDSWHSYHNNYSADFSKFQRPSRPTDLE